MEHIFTNPNWQEEWLKTLRLCIEIGAYGGMEDLIKEHHENVLKLGNAETLREYYVILDESKEKREHVKIHGRQSLLKMEHPLVQKMIAESISKT